MAIKINDATSAAAALQGSIGFLITYPQLLASAREIEREKRFQSRVESYGQVESESASSAAVEADMTNTYDVLVNAQLTELTKLLNALAVTGNAFTGYFNDSFLRAKGLEAQNEAI